MNRILLLILGLLFFLGGRLLAIEAWTELDYAVPQMPSAQALPAVQPYWKLNTETKVAVVPAVTRVEQRRGGSNPMVTWISEGMAVTQEPDGSLAIAHKHDFDLPSRPSSKDLKSLSPISHFEAGGRNIQVFEIKDSRDMLVRVWVEQDSGRVLARAGSGAVSLYTDDEIPVQLQLPENLRASIKEFKRKRQKAADVGRMPAS